MAFSLADVANIMAGTPTPEIMAATAQMAAVATHGLAPVNPQAYRAPLLESNDPNQSMDTMEAELSRRLAAKAARGGASPPAAPAPQVLQEAPAPQWKQTAAPNPSAPLAGYPMPGIRTIPGKAAGNFNPEQGGVPQDDMARMLGLAAPTGPSPMQRLHESLNGMIPQDIAPIAPQVQRPPLMPASYLPQPPAVTPEALRRTVREVLFQEVLDEHVLAPLLDQLVKTHLRGIVREELERLARKGQQK